MDLSKDPLASWPSHMSPGIIGRKNEYSSKMGIENYLPGSGLSWRYKNLYNIYACTYTYVNCRNLDNMNIHVHTYMWTVEALVWMDATV